MGTLATVSPVRGSRTVNSMVCDTGWCYPAKGRSTRAHLRTHYDPDSRFTIAVLWPGNAGPQSAERRLLCGLQLLGPNGQPITFKERWPNKTSRRSGRLARV